MEKKIETNMTNVFDAGLTKEELIVLLIEREKELIKDLHIKNQREINNKLANKSKLRIKMDNCIRKYPSLTFFLIELKITRNYKSRIVIRFRYIIRYFNSILK